MKKVLFFQLLLFITCYFSSIECSYGQTRQVSGKVINAETGNPLPNIVLQLKGVAISTKTNSFGKYKLTVPDSLSKVEFEETPTIKVKRYDLRGKNGLDVYVKDLNIQDLLALSFDDLMNLTVTTAGKREEQIADIPASVVVITKTEIAKYGYRSLQELLENVPGMYVIDQYAHTDVTLGVRGFWASSTKGVIIMVNGVNQFQDIYAHYPLNRVGVPIESIERIEIIRGPMSVIYGSGAFYGAINIITNSSQNEELAGQLSVKTGSDKHYGGSVNASVSKEDFNVNIIGSMYNDDGLNVPWSKFSDDPYYKTGTTENFFENSSYYYSVSGAYKSIYGDINVVRDSKTWIFLGLDKTLPNRKLSDFANARIGYKKQFNKLSLDCKLSYSSTNIQSGNTFAHDPKDQYLDFSHWALGSQAYDLDLLSVYKPSQNFDISFGANYRRLLQSYELLNMPSINFPDVAIWQPYRVKLQSGGVFAQANWQFAQKFKLVAGMRLEKRGNGLNIWEANYGHPLDDPLPFRHYDLYLAATKIQFIPRLALIFSPNSKNTIKLLYGKAIRFPAYHEYNDIVEPETPDLEPEKISTIEINYIASFSQNLMMNVSLYSNNLDNLIYRKEFFDRVGQYHAITTNEGEMNTTGMEAILRYNVSRKLSTDVSFTFQETKDQQNIGREVTCSPKILAYIKASYKVDKDLTVSVTGNFVDKMVAQWNSTKIFIDGTVGGRIGADTPSYWNFGVNLRYENIFKIKGIFANLKCSNILDQEIRYPTYSHSSWAEKGTLGSGRRFLMSVGYNF